MDQTISEKNLIINANKINEKSKHLTLIFVYNENKIFERKFMLKKENYLINFIWNEINR